MLRIRLGMDDLARMVLAPTGVADTIEAVYSTIALRRANSRLLYGDWGTRLRPRLGAAVAPLLALFTSPAQVPLFMVNRTDDPEAFAEHLLALPTSRIRAELPVTGPYARRLADGDRDARRQLATAVRTYHHAFADALPTMHALVDADVADRTALLAERGLGALLDSLHPAMRWRSPVLEIDVPVHREIELDGRVLKLTPSVFLRDTPGVLIEPDIAFITYPVRGSLRLGTGGGHDPLAELLGRTRAAVLRELRTGRTTTELAERLGISPASASEHAAVLRRTRLITTRREGRSVRHRLTTLGRHTLAGEPPP